MTETTTKPKETIELVPDPHNVPVTFSNVFFGGGLINGVINCTLGVTRHSPTTTNQSAVDVIVAARLRLDIAAATALRDFLSAQIALLSAPQDKSQAN